VEILDKKAQAQINIVRSQLLHKAKLRAKEKGLEFTITRDDVVIPELCPILLEPLRIKSGTFNRLSPSLDRINNNLGYVPGNVKIISWQANYVKANMTPEQVERLYWYVKGELN
jgi:hypothetical protein